MDGTLHQISLFEITTYGGLPLCGLFGPFFLILKNLHQNLSNEGSNFILSQKEVGH